MGFIVSALPFVIKILGFFLDRAQASKEARKKFLDMVAKLEREFSLKSMKFHQSYEEALAELRAAEPSE